MRRVAVIGCPGSGKSVLSRRFGESLGLPVIHLDNHYWKAGWTPTPNEQWDDFLERTVSEPEWIVDGNYTRTLDIRLKAADTIVFLDMPTLLCLYRIIKRHLMYRRVRRPDLNEGCEEKLDVAFIRVVWNYREKIRPQVMEAIRRHEAGKRVIVLTSRREVRDFASGTELSK